MHRCQPSCTRRKPVWDSWMRYGSRERNRSRGEGCPERSGENSTARPSPKPKFWPYKSKPDHTRSLVGGVSCRALSLDAHCTRHTAAATVARRTATARAAVHPLRCWRSRKLCLSQTRCSSVRLSARNHDMPWRIIDSITAICSPLFTVRLARTIRQLLWNPSPNNHRYRVANAVQSRHRTFLNPAV